jgi:hypothetical protein
MKMRMRKILIGISTFVLLFAFTARHSKAAPDNNPIYQAIAELEAYVNERFDEVWVELSGLPDSLSALADRVTQNESDIALLGERADSLEEDVGLLTTDVSDNSTDIGLLGDRVETLEGQEVEVPEAIDVAVYPDEYITHLRESDVIEASGHELLILKCDFIQGTGGIWTYYSDDQINWTHANFDGCSGNSNDPNKIYAISTVKGDYYKFSARNTYRAIISVILY